MNTIQIFLNERGLTQTELAEQLGFTTGYISMILSGQRIVTDTFRWRFLKTFGPEATDQVFSSNGHDHDS